MSNTDQTNSILHSNPVFFYTKFYSSIYYFILSLIKTPYSAQKEAYYHTTTTKVLQYPMTLPTCYDGHKVSINNKTINIYICVWNPCLAEEQQALDNVQALDPSAPEHRDNLLSNLRIYFLCRYLVINKQKNHKICKKSAEVQQMKRKKEKVNWERKWTERKRKKK